MRRILSKKEELKKQKKRQFAIAVVLIIVLFGSVFGYVVGFFNGDNAETANELSYNGYSFVSDGGYWNLDWNGMMFNFLYHPSQTEDVLLDSPVNGDISDYYNVPVYIYSEEGTAEIEIYRNIFPVAERIQSACIEGKECEDKIPVKDCSDKFIIIEESLTNEIVEEDKCVYIRGSKENLIKLTDDYLFRILGVK